MISYSLVLILEGYLATNVGGFARIIMIVRGTATINLTQNFVPLTPTYPSCRRLSPHEGTHRLKKFQQSLKPRVKVVYCMFSFRI